MSEEQNQENPKIPPRADHTTALSLFDQAGGMNDFPVLKAFQEYIEAEQTRSRKRMLGLSIFFVVLLVVVVITFSVIMAAVINRDQQNMTAITARNQELSDKLLDIALRARETPRQPVVTVQSAAPQPAVPPSQDSVLKPLLEKIEHLASAISAKPQPAAGAAPPQTVESAETLRLREELRRQKEALEGIRAEREKLKAEQELKAARERLRQEQIELHRRRLYPEHYAREDARKAAVPPPAEKPKPAAPKPVAQLVDLKTVKPISYFDEPEPPAAQPASPAAAPQPKKEEPRREEPKKNELRTQTLNVSSQEGETVPFLIELPAAGK